jgi:hypothetical protein
MRHRAVMLNAAHEFPESLREAIGVFQERGVAAPEKGDRVIAKAARGALAARPGDNAVASSPGNPHGTIHLRN